MYRRIIRCGTARDHAGLGVGYSASGESQHSRQSANAGGAYHKARPGRPECQTPDELLARTAKQLAKLMVDIDLESNRERRAKLIRDRDLKSALVERLQTEAGRGPVK